MSVDHYENFPVASWLCPPAMRPAVRAIYWFARTADDIADEGDAPPAERLAKLQAYRAALRQCARPEPGPPLPAASPSAWPGVFEPLAQAIRQHQLPLPLLEALLDAFEHDAGNPVYDTRAQLLAYCACSANPVGRLLLHLHGDHDPIHLAQSDAVCSALQLINFWQDLSVDRPRGRFYVPAEDARPHGLHPLERSKAALPPAAAAALATDLCGWARNLMLTGAPLARAVPGRLGWELRLVVHGGLTVLDKVQALGAAAWTSRPRLVKADVPGLLWRALCATPKPPLSRAPVRGRAAP